MTDSVRALRVNTVELLRQPGVHRDVELRVRTDDLGVHDDRLVDDTVSVDLDVVSNVDGIMVDGRVEATWVDSCRRCLREIVRAVPVVVDELYQRDVTDPDAYELGSDALDLTPVVRDAALLALDAPPELCSADCAGICPVCGADRNTSPCSCDTGVRDERWAALDELRVDDD